MRVLVACEYSGTVRQAFRNKGHGAWSCDLLPAADESPYHYQTDVLDVLYEDWDLLIAHPPCTYLTNSGVRWLHSDPGRWNKMEEGADLFTELMNANHIPRRAIENPIMHKHAVNIIGRRQDQVLQPWMFGHLESKAVCLWLVNLPKLTETNNVREEMMKLPKSKRTRVHFSSPGPDRWKERSKFFSGMAEAMADQWGSL